MKTKAILLLVGVLMGTQSSILYSQNVTYRHDNQKYKQWNSMENGGWSFAPDWYYYTLHKNYSGAEMYWTWTLGFIPVPHIRFKETNSNIKRIYDQRTLELAQQVLTKNQAQAHLDTITPVFNEEVIRNLDRNVDYSYTNYKDDFEKMQTHISETLSFCMERSKGDVSDMVELIQTENEILLNDIDYTHKTGINNEMENAKRQISYEEATIKMKELCNISSNLVLYTLAYY